MKITTELENEIIAKCRATRKHLKELDELTGDGRGMVVKEGVKEKILNDFFIAVNEILSKRGIGK